MYKISDEMKVYRTQWQLKWISYFHKRRNDDYRFDRPIFHLTSTCIRRH